MRYIKIKNEPSLSCVFLVIFIGMGLLPVLSIDFICWIQPLLFGANDMLFMTSNIFDKPFNFIMMGGCFCWVILHGYSQRKINLLQLQIVGVVYIGIILFFTFSCTVFDEQRILKRDIFNYSGILYKYSDVEKVSVYARTYSRSNVTNIYYELIMKDGYKINLINMNINEGFLFKWFLTKRPEYFKKTLSKILHIEQKIKSAPHTVEKWFLDESNHNFPKAYFNKFNVE